MYVITLEQPKKKKTHKTSNTAKKLLMEIKWNKNTKSKKGRTRCGGKNRWDQCKTNSKMVDLTHKHINNRLSEN